MMHRGDEEKIFSGEGGSELKSRGCSFSCFFLQIKYSGKEEKSS
jgi:hypothetical protein